MGKVKAPLLSLGASGTIGDALTYQERGQVKFAREKPIPQYRRSLAQNYQRWEYEDAIFFWNSLSDAQKAIYRTAGAKQHMTAYAYAIMVYLRTLPDLAGRWRLDERSGAVAYDSSKNQNNGTIIGASPAFGRINGAFLFDGLNDRVVCPSTSSLDLVDAVSLELFINPVVKANYQHAAGKRTLSDGFYMFFDASADQKMFFNIRVANVSHLALTDNPIPTGQWTHLVGTYDRVRIKIFMNGQEQLSGFNYTAPIPVTVGTFDIGRASYGTYYINSFIDHVALYNRVLDPAQILNHAERRYPL